MKPLAAKDDVGKVAPPLEKTDGGVDAKDSRDSCSDSVASMTPRGGSSAVIAADGAGNGRGDDNKTATTELQTTLPSLPSGGATSVVPPPPQPSLGPAGRAAAASGRTGGCLADYEIVEPRVVLGKGGFGEVVLATRLADRKRCVAFHSS